MAQHVKTELGVAICAAMAAVNVARASLEFSPLRMPSLDTPELQARITGISRDGSVAFGTLGYLDEVANVRRRLATIWPTPDQRLTVGERPINDTWAGGPAPVAAAGDRVLISADYPSFDIGAHRIAQRVIRTATANASGLMLVSGSNYQLGDPFGWSPTPIFSVSNLSADGQTFYSGNSLSQSWPSRIITRRQLVRFGTFQEIDTGRDVHYVGFTTADASAVLINGNAIYRESGIIELDTTVPSGASAVRAELISADGSIVVGSSELRWDSKDIPVIRLWSGSSGNTLAEFPLVGGYLTGLSGDGSVIVTSGAERHTIFFRQTATTYQQWDANTLLAGVLPAGITILSVNGISDNGLVIAGTYRTAEGAILPYRATIPSPTTAVSVGAAMTFLTAWRRRRHA